jgi:hypothetical protein
MALACMLPPRSKMSRAASPSASHVYGFIRISIAYGYAQLRVHGTEMRTCFFQISSLLAPTRCSCHHVFSHRYTTSHATSALHQAAQPSCKPLSTSQPRLRTGAQSRARADIYHPPRLASPPDGRCRYTPMGSSAPRRRARPSGIIGDPRGSSAVEHIGNLRAEARRKVECVLALVPPAA